MIVRLLVGVLSYAVFYCAFAQIGVGIGVLAFAAYLFHSGYYKGLSNEIKSLQTECDALNKENDTKYIYC